MTPVVVNGHLLPETLAEMLAAGHWGPSSRPTDLSALPIEDKEDLTLLDLPQIVANTRSLQAAFDRGEGRVLRLVRGNAVPGHLDVDQAVMIAVTYGQEALVLDYSSSGPPRVLATADEGSGGGWVEVAANFDDLLGVIGLSGDTT